MQSEKEIQAAVRYALGIEGTFRMFRNNVGVLPDGHGGFIRYGLAKGSADLIGIMQTNGRFISCEIKKPKTGRASEEQTAWAATIRKFGGFACTVRSVDEAMAALERAKRGESQ